MIDIGRGYIVEGLVIPLVVVILDKGRNLNFEFLRTVIVRVGQAHLGQQGVGQERLRS